MVSCISRRLALSAAFALGIASQVAAQSAGAPPSVGASTPCSYDACALRQEGTALVLGARGQFVGRVGAFGWTRLEPLFASASDSARTQARVFDRNYRAGIVLVWTGALAAPAIALGLHAARGGSRSELSATYVGVLAIGLGTELVGLMKVTRAQRALGRAIWWYNRDLPR